MRKSPKVQLLKAQQEVKECYTEQEIITLLKKPDIKTTTFIEFRTWCKCQVTFYNLRSKIFTPDYYQNSFALFQSVTVTIQV